MPPRGSPCSDRPMQRCFDGPKRRCQRPVQARGPARLGNRRRNQPWSDLCSRPGPISTVDPAPPAAEGDSDVQRYPRQFLGQSCRILRPPRVRQAGAGVTAQALACQSRSFGPVDGTCADFASSPVTRTAMYASRRASFSEFGRAAAISRAARLGCRENSGSSATAISRSRCCCRSSSTCSSEPVRCIMPPHCSQAGPRSRPAHAGRDDRRRVGQRRGGGLASRSAAVAGAVGGAVAASCRRCRRPRLGRRRRRELAASWPPSGRAPPA